MRKRTAIKAKFKKINRIVYKFITNLLKYRILFKDILTDLLDLIKEIPCLKIKPAQNQMKRIIVS